MTCLSDCYGVGGNEDSKVHRLPSYSLCRAGDAVREMHTQTVNSKCTVHEPVSAKGLQQQAAAAGLLG